MEYKVQNIGPIENVEGTTERICAFVGKNGTGKTSFRRAFEFALTGKFDDRFIRHGTDFAFAKIQVGGHLIERGKRAGKATVLHFDGKNSTVKNMEEALKAEKIRLDKAVAHIGADYFSTLKNGDIDALLMSVFPAAIPATREAVSGMTDITPDALDELMGMVSGKEELLAADIPGLYNTVFQKRRDVGRDIRSLKAQVPDDAEADELSETDRETLEKRRKDVRAEQMAYVKKRAEYDAAVKANEAVAAKKAELLKTIAETKDIEAPDPEKVKKYEETAARLYGAAGQYEGLINAKKSTVENLTREMKAMQNGVCPLNKSVTCDHDWSDRRKSTQEAIDTLTAEIAAIQGKLDKANANIENYKKWRKENEAALRAAEKRKSAESALQTLPAETAVKEPEPAYDYDAVLQETDTLLAQYDARSGAREAAEQLAELEGRYEVLDELVKVLEPGKGLQNRILASAVDKYQNFVNKMAGYMKFPVQLSFVDETGNVRVRATKDGKTFVDLDQLSTGEFSVVSFLLAELVNLNDRCRVLFIDNIDRMDTGVLSGFLALLKADKFFETVILTGVSHTDTVETLKANLIPVYDIGNGMQAL